MLRLIRTPKGAVSVLFKNGSIEEVWTNSTRWLWTTGSISQFLMGSRVDLPRGVELEANKEAIKDFAEIIELKQGEIAVHLRNGVFYNVLIPGVYAFWRGVRDNEFLKLDTTELELPENLNKVLWPVLKTKGFLRRFKVAQGEEGLLLRNGELLRHLNPGEYFFWNNQEDLQVLSASMKRQTLELNGQEMLSRDKATLRINLLAEMKVVNLEQALMQNKEFSKQAYLLLSMALRSFVARLSLDELLGGKEQLAESVAETSKASFAELGLELISVGIRDIILPGEMREIMNQVLIAEKKAQANLVTRREETASTRSLMNTAKLMENNPMLWKLKEMEYLEKVVEKVGTINISGGELGEKLRQIFSSA